MHCYHVFANGADSVDFILDREDYRAAFNRVGVCAYAAGVEVLAFSIEETHPHKIIRGTAESCSTYVSMYRRSTMAYITNRRGNADGVRLDLEMELLDSEEYLLSAVAYTIIQPTKDGKPVMFYDYEWGTGSMYFRKNQPVPLWRVSEDGLILPVERVSDLSVDARREILCSRMEVPEDWIICNGILLPQNYIDPRNVEDIFKTHNRYRAFCSGSKKFFDSVLEHMAASRGVVLDDVEMKKKCGEMALEMFGTVNVRRLDAFQRISLARRLRKECGIAYSQLSRCVHVPADELRKYL